MSEDLRCKCGHPREFHFSNSKSPVPCDFDGACPAGCTEFVPAGTPTVPRVARSVDDLRVGQWIATRGDDGWETRTVCDSLISVPYWDFDGDRVVILADAPDQPARDWLIPATQMEALESALGYKGIWSVSPKDYEAFAAMRDAARAVLDAAREVEHE